MDETEKDFIFANSAMSAGASVLTTAVRSDSCVKDWAAKGMKRTSKKISVHVNKNKQKTYQLFVKSNV